MLTYLKFEYCFLQKHVYYLPLLMAVIKIVISPLTTKIPLLGRAISALLFHGKTFFLKQKISMFIIFTHKKTPNSITLHVTRHCHLSYDTAGSADF